MDKPIELGVSRRNFNRVKFGTKTTIEALVASGWSQTYQAEPYLSLVEKNGVIVKAPPPGHCGLEWTWGKDFFRLAPEEKHNG